MLIKKLKLALIGVVFADIIALIFEYSTIQLGAFNLGSSAYNAVQLVLRLKY